MDMRRRAHPAKGSRRLHIWADPRPNMGVGLVGAVVSRATLDADIANFRRTGLSQEAAGDVTAVASTRRTIESLVDQLSSLETQITEERSALWGTSTEDLNDA